MHALLRRDWSGVNARDINGWTALHWAVAVDAGDCVGLLLATPQIDVYGPSRQNETVFHLAARRGSISLAMQLVNHYLVPPVVNASLATRPSLECLLRSPSDYGQSALDLAMRLASHDLFSFFQTVLNSQCEYRRETDMEFSARGP